MPQNNEPTTRFRVDVSQLKAGIQEANRQIRLANAQFKAASSGMDDWANSTDGLTAKINQLETIVASETTKLNNLKEQLRLVEQEQGENSVAADEMRIAVANQQAAVNRAERGLRDYQTRLDELASAQSDSGDAAEDQLTAYQKLQREISKQESELEDLKEQYKNVVMEQGENSSSAQYLARHISRLSDSLNDNREELANVDRQADELDGSFDDLDGSAEEATGGFTIMKGALANLVAEGITAAVDAFKELITSTDSAANTFQAATGASTEAMEGYNEAIEAIYKNNFGESLDDVAQKMAKVSEVTGEVDASKLQDLTEKAITLEDTFGMDMTESLRGVQNLVTHFGVSADEAFDLMASGAQNGLNYSDELGDNVAEYSGKFAEAGFSAEEYFQLLQNGSQGGAYNLDKVNDSINEVTARLADGTIGDGIGQFSKSTQDLFAAWQNGEASQKDVINSIVSDIQSTTNEQEKMNLAALAFGTMAEDGGTKFIESLSAVGDTFTDTKGKMDEIESIKYDDVSSQLSGLGRTVQTDLIAPFVEELLPYIKEGVQWLIDNMPAVTDKVGDVVQGVKDFIKGVQDAMPVIAGLGVALAGLAITALVGNFSKIIGLIRTWSVVTKAQTVFQTLLNVAMNMNPIGIIISLIAGLVTAFVLLWNKSEAFRNFWIGLWEGIKTAVSTAWESISGFFSAAWETIQQVWGAVSTWFNDNVLQPVIGFFSAAIETIKEVFNTVVTWIAENIVGPTIAFFSSIWEGIVAIFTPAIEWFSALFTSIWATLSSIITVIVGLCKGTWEIIKAVFGAVSAWFNDNVIQPVAKFFTSLWDGIKNAAQAAWDFIKSVFIAVSTWFNTNVIQPVSKFFTSMWDGIKNAASAAWEGIKSVFNAVSNWFSKNVTEPVSKFFTQTWDGLKKGASDAWDGIKKVFGKVADFFKDTFSKAWNGVKDIFSAGSEIFGGIKEGIENTFKSVVNGLIDGINKITEAPFNAINSMLNKIRGTEIMGFKPFEGLWGEDPISIPAIPKLARGGVLKRGQIGLLEGNGAEAVVPLENNAAWIRKTASDLNKQLQSSGGVGGLGGSQNVVNNYNFTQTNTSPKALSRLEIYRQTKNQLSLARGV